MASEFFCECFRDNVGLDLRLDAELLEPTVLLLELLHPGHQRHVHAAVLTAPLVERRRTDPMLPAQVRHRRSGLRVLQHRQDLAVRKSRSLHVELPPGEKILLLRPSLQWGDYPGFTCHR